jgi:signal transduction histidine kinase
MDSRDTPNHRLDPAASAGAGQAPPGGDARRITLVSGASLVLVGMVGLLGWLADLPPLTSIQPQYAPIALYATAFFAAAGCILLWHANRAWTPAAFSIATLVSIVISLTGLLAVAEYFTSSELTLETLIVPGGELRNGLPVGHLSPVGAAFFALLAPALWLGLRPGASPRSRQGAALVGLFIALAGGVMTMGYLMGEPLLYGGNIIPVAALAALGFTFLGAGLSAAAGNDVAPLLFLTGDSLRARLLRIFLPLSVSLAVVQATAHAVIVANAADPAVLTALWSIAFLILTGALVTYATSALGRDYDLAQLKRRQAEEKLQWDLALETALSALYEPLVSPTISQSEMAHSVLEQARRLTGSEHGYVFSIDPGAGESLVHAFTRMTVDGCEVASSGRDFKLRPGEDGRYPALWGEALNTGQAFFTNSPPSHPAARGLPAGHLPLRQFLSVPVLLGSELAGQIALANPGRDYTVRDLQAVRRMGEFYALAIQTQRARVQVLELNTGLEQRVRERTQELEASSRELEAFSYSVSHDLRAPLRGVDGWSLALLEDYGDSLDEQAKVYLDRVRSETQRMGLLIDDLMKLSRVTRSDMRRQPVNLTALAARIAQRLRTSQPQRAVEWIIQPDLTAQGDSRLLEIALDNLLTNAWKFTAKRAQARITFGRLQGEDRSSNPGDGARRPDSRPVFYVRDDGAGFDMAHASRLFSPFQRLHKTAEFPGTGIGLATVARIVRRHGGHIWTEAAVGQGATFYFTL